MGREIVFFRSRSGRCPFEEFLDSLTGEEAKRLAWLLELIGEVPRIPDTYFRKLGGTDGLWEGRVRFRSKAFRALGFFLSGTVFVITNGFVKGSRKTPRNEIETAEQRRREYLGRLGKNG